MIGSYTTKPEISVLRMEEDTVVDGPGLRTVIYAAGCKNACPGCHNPQSWDIRNGEMIPIDRLMERIRKNDRPVTFSGGDPLLQPLAFARLAQRIKKEIGKDIWCYTGYRYEQIAACPVRSVLLPFIDVLVDGRFEITEQDPSLPFRGSRNQRLIDVRKSLESGRAVELHYNPHPF